MYAYHSTATDIDSDTSKYSYFDLDNKHDAATETESTWNVDSGNDNGIDTKTEEKQVMALEQVETDVPEDEE